MPSATDVDSETVETKPITWASEFRLACAGCLVCFVLLGVVFLLFGEWFAYEAFGGAAIREVPHTPAGINAFVYSSGFPDDTRYYYVQSAAARERLYRMSIFQSESHFPDRLVFSADGIVVAAETFHRASNPGATRQADDEDSWLYTHSFECGTEAYRKPDFSWQKEEQERASLHRDIKTLLEAHGGRGKVYPGQENIEASFRTMGYWENKRWNRKIHAGADFTAAHPLGQAHSVAPS